jgi:hypothetical protein
VAGTFRRRSGTAGDDSDRNSNGRNAAHDLLRSESIFGLSFVIMIFDDSSVNDWNRQKVLERLTQVDLPNGQNLQPQIGTDWSTTGQIYWYTIRSTNPRYDLMEQRSIEDWVLSSSSNPFPMWSMFPTSAARCESTRCAWTRTSWCRMD